MSNFRFMRTLLMFDLPTLTAQDRRHFQKFVKYLEKSGYIRFEKSVYMKMTLNSSQAEKVIADAKKNLPPAGIIAALTITEKEFSGIDYLLGEITSDVVSSPDRVVDL